MDALQAAPSWTVLPQVIDDPATGLTLQFRVSANGELTLTVIGDLPLGNREFIFASDGSLAGTGFAPAPTAPSDSAHRP